MAHLTRSYLPWILSLLLFLAILGCAWYLNEQHQKKEASCEAEKAKLLAEKLSLENRINFWQAVLKEDPCVAKAKLKLEYLK